MRCCFLVSLRVCARQRKLELAPADLIPPWCWELSGQTWLITVFGGNWDSWEPAVLGALHFSSSMEVCTPLRKQSPPPAPNREQAGPAEIFGMGKVYVE